MRTITLEEHFATQVFMEGPGRELKSIPAMAKIVEQLCDLDSGRLAAMDAADIDVQVLSLNSPGTEQLDAAGAIALARESNDLLGEAVRRHTTRLSGFAALPTSAPDTAADELTRTVRDYGFKGAVINGHNRGPLPGRSVLLANP